MNEIKVRTSSSSIGLGAILFVVFLILKLTGHIDWSWVWVLAPIWVPAAFVLSILVIPIIAVFIIALIVRNR